MESKRKAWWWVALGLNMALSGCVVGSGPCLWLQSKQAFSGHVHFREFPAADGIDTVPILELDKTQYVYTPSQSFQCLPLNDAQLVGVVEFPPDVGENSHIVVEGSVSQAVSGHEYTHFLIKVIAVLPTNTAPR
jgi:hypothetical protein